jgi:hypothetical protein
MPIENDALINRELDWQLEELELQQENISKLLAELQLLDSKVKGNETITADDTRFIAELGWLATLSITVIAIAAAL